MDFDDDESEKFTDPKELDIYKKGWEIFELANTTTGLIDEENPMLAAIKGMMLEYAALLSVKVAGAEAGGLYAIRMENACIIRKAARDLLVNCRSLEMHGFKDVHYLQLIQEAIEAYRLLFVAWVHSFDPWNFVYDSWGLFNPPGAREEPEF